MEGSIKELRLPALKLENRFKCYKCERFVWGNGTEVIWQYYSYQNSITRRFCSHACKYELYKARKWKQEDGIKE
jgi:hypothetical protein